MRKESPLAVLAVWSGEEALLGITLFINEPCLKGRAYKRCGSFPGGQGSPRAGGMLRRDAEIPRAQSRQGHGPAAVLREHKLSHQDRSPQVFPLQPGSLRAHSVATPCPSPSPIPAQPPAGWHVLGGGSTACSRAAQSRLYPRSCRNFVSLRLRVQFRQDGPTHAWALGGRWAALLLLSRFLRKTGLETQPPGSEAGGAAATQEHLLLLRGPRRRFDPRA